MIKTFLLLLIGVVVGVSFSLVDQHLKGESHFDWISAVFFSAVSFAIVDVYDMHNTLETNLKKSNEESFQRIRQEFVDREDFLVKSIGAQMPEFLTKYDENNNQIPLFLCKPALSTEVIDTFLRRNWEVTIKELWGEKNKHIIEKLTATHLDALRVEANGFFEDRVAEFLQKGKVGFVFMNPRCPVGQYAYWAKRFEASPKKSLYAANVLLPSELFSKKNLANAIDHALTFNSNPVVDKKRIQIFTDERVLVENEEKKDDSDDDKNSYFRSEDQFVKELRETVFSTDQMEELMHELVQAKNKDNVIAKDFNETIIQDIIGSFQKKYNKPEPTSGDWYKLLFERNQSMKWRKCSKVTLGENFFGDYVLIDESIVVRYTADTETLELLCGEVVQEFLTPFETLFS